MELSNVRYQDPIEQIQKSYENTMKSKYKQRGSITERITQNVLYPENGIKGFVDELLSVDKEIRTVMIINNKENTLISKTQKDAVNPISTSDEEQLAIDLQKIRQFNEEFDESLGKTTFLHMTRNWVHQLVWFVQDLIISVTLKSTLGNYQVEEIAKKIQNVFDHTKIISESKGESISQFRRS